MNASLVHPTIEVLDVTCICGTPFIFDGDLVELGGAELSIGGVIVRLDGQEFLQLGLLNHGMVGVLASAIARYFAVTSDDILDALADIGALPEGDAS